MFLCVIATLRAPARAHAETALLLPPKGDEALKKERLQANVVLGDALQAQGIKVVPHSEAVTSVGGGAASDCDSVDCAPALLQAASADVAAALAVWAAGDPPAPSTVFVTLVDRRGERFPGKARVEDADLARATKEALLDARALQLLGPGPWLRVRGKPEGAQVLLNGKLVGTLPYRAPVHSGRQTLEVRYEGLRTHAQTVDIPPNATRQVEVDVDLVPRPEGTLAVKDAEADVVRDSSTGERSHPIVGPIILGTIGVAVLAVDIASLAGAGCNQHDANGVCLQRDSVNRGSAIAWGAIGVGAIAGALIWHLVGGSRETDRSVSRTAPALGDGASLSLRVGPTSVSLHSRF
jgi:hypothetical protein